MVDAESLHSSSLSDSSPSKQNSRQGSPGSRPWDARMMESRSTDGGRRPSASTSALTRSLQILR
eukprot:1272671-Rhodomonas_salina.1